MTSGFGKLYLIPTPLGKNSVNTSLPEFTLQQVHKIRHFAVENLRQAVSFLTWAGHPVPEYELHFYELTKHTNEFQLQELIQEILNGKDMGVLTDAGCPGIADPGSGLARLAHAFDVEVVPLTGPSSPLLALMASGLGGQQFAFNGYLPFKQKAREQKITELEKRSAETGMTELFMETPHRNDELFKSLLRTLKNDTQLCVAANLTLEGEYIKMREVSDWKPRKAPEIDKIPAIFGIKAKQALQMKDLKKIKPVKKKFGK